MFTIGITKRALEHVGERAASSSRRFVNTGRLARNAEFLNHFLEYDEIGLLATCAIRASASTRRRTWRALHREVASQSMDRR